MWYTVKHRVDNGDKENNLKVVEVSNEDEALKLIEETMKAGTFISADCSGVSDAFYDRYAELSNNRYNGGNKS